MRRIIGIGETVLDVIFRDDRPQDAIPGGSTFNAMISLGRMMKKDPAGAPVMMVTEVGDDHVGDIIVNFMERNGVLTSAVTRNPGTQSHLSLAFLNSACDAQYEFYKDHANAGLSAQKVDRVEFGPEDIVLYGSFFAVNPVIRESTRKLLQKARGAGAILYYDINFRANHIKDLPLIKDNIFENIALADFVRGSAEDFRYLFGTDDGREIYESHIRPLCRNFILTRGADSTQVFQDDTFLEFPVREIDPVSTIGAGDNFNAGFIYGLVRNGVAACPLPDQAQKCSTGRIPGSGLERGSALLPDKTLMRSLVAVASAFSAEVCRSIYNYVPEDFEV